MEISQRINGDNRIRTAAPLGGPVDREGQERSFGVVVTICVPVCYNSLTCALNICINYNYLKTSNKNDIMSGLGNL